MIQYVLSMIYYFKRDSLDTDNFLRPLARRPAMILRPFFVAIRDRKPCLFLRFLLEG